MSCCDGSSLLVLFLLLFRIQAQDRCEDPPITFSTRQFEFNPSFMEVLRCDISISNPTWWSSTGPCGPFRNSSLCSDGSSTCMFTLANIRNEFYHCCTSGEQVEEQARGTDTCFYTKICTTVVPERQSSPPFAYFGDTQSVYISVNSSHPAPANSSLVTFSLPINSTAEIIEFPPTATRTRPLLDPPLITVQYIITIPSVADLGLSGSLEGPATLFFRTFFNGVCTGSLSASARFEVYESEEAPSPPTVTTTTVLTQPSPGATDGMTDCSINVGLVVAVVLGVLLGLAVVVIVAAAILIFCILHSRRSVKVPSSEGNSSRPTNLPTQYSRLKSQDQGYTPSPFPGNLPPGHHGNGTQTNGTQANGIRGPPATPTPAPNYNHNTPNSLALGVTQQPSHTGTTPLIAFTPAGEHGPRLPGFPNNLAPSSPSTDQESPQSGMAMIAKKTEEQYATVAHAPVPSVPSVVNSPRAADLKLSPGHRQSDDVVYDTATVAHAPVPSVPSVVNSPRAADLKLSPGHRQSDDVVYDTATVAHAPVPSVPSVVNSPRAADLKLSPGHQSDDVVYDTNKVLDGAAKVELKGANSSQLSHV